MGINAIIGVTRNTSPDLDPRPPIPALDLRPIPDVDLHPVAPRRFIPTLKNPCWLEDGNSTATATLDPYKGNPYQRKDFRAKASFTRLLHLRSTREKVNSDGGTHMSGRWEKENLFYVLF